MTRERVRCHHHCRRRRDSGSSQPWKNVVIAAAPLLPCASQFLLQPSPKDCRPHHRRRSETAIALLAGHQTSDVLSRKYLILPSAPHASVARRFPCPVEISATLRATAELEPDGRADSRHT